MICPKCNSTTSDDSTFCVKCGAKVNNFSEQPIRKDFQTTATSQSTVIKINTYLVPAILATIFCCLPFGVVSIVFAASANTSLANRDFEGAQKNADKAKTWFWVSFITGLVIGVLYFLISIVGALAS